MTDILTPAALAEIRERAARTHSEWLDAEWLKDCPNAMLHAAREFLEGHYDQALPA